MQVVMGIHIQQLDMSKISKNGKSVEYYCTKDPAEKGGIWLNIQDIMNLKLFVNQKVSFTILWKFLMITKFLMG